LPVVATAAGGTSESFEHNITGLLATSSTVEEIAALVGEYLADKNRLEKVAIHGPYFVERTFGASRMIEETIELYGFHEARNTSSVDLEIVDARSGYCEDDCRKESGK
jgi:glycosyltransferase involved in cell wall biosynthesis